MATIYKGFTIEPETEPWAIKYGYNWKFYQGTIDIDNVFHDANLSYVYRRIDDMILEDGLTNKL